MCDYVDCLSVGSELYQVKTQMHMHKNISIAAVWTYCQIGAHFTTIVIWTKQNVTLTYLALYLKLLIQENSVAFLGKNTRSTGIGYFWEFIGNIKSLPLISPLILNYW